jgi:hypothetical protein
VGAYAAIYPYRQVTLLLFFVIPVTMTARTMALLFGGISVLMLRSGGPIAHAAHLAGGLAGYFYGLRMVGERAFGGNGRGFRLWSAGDVRDWIAKIRRSRLRVMRPYEDHRPVDWARVDQILIKVKLQGFGSLTPVERDELERASRSAEQQRR